MTSAVAITPEISQEFSYYLKCERMLLARNPDEIDRFLNKLIMQEVRI